MCVCLKYESNIPTEAPWEEQVVLQVWGHQGLDRSDATDGGLSDIRMVATWIQSRCGPRLFAHNYVHRCTVCFALTLVFLVSVAAAVEFVWQPWQQGGGRQVGDVHSFQARRFGSLWSLEVLILDSKKGMCAPFPKRHWNLIPVMTDRSWHSRLHRSIIRHKLTTILHIDATISVHWFTELASVIVQAMAMVEVAKRSKAKSYEKVMFFSMMFRCLTDLNRFDRFLWWFHGLSSPWSWRGFATAFCHWNCYVPSGCGEFPSGGEMLIFRMEMMKIVGSGTACLSY